MIGEVTKAMAEQTTAMGQIAGAAENMRMQADQSTRAVKEQAQVMKQMTVAAQNTSKQIKLITAANREHSTVSGTLLASLGEIREISERNARTVKRTRGGTDDLLRRAGTLTTLFGQAGRRGRNGRANANA